MKLSLVRRVRVSALFSFLLFLCPTYAVSQSSGASETCASTAAVSVPSRPTIASATDPTQCGIVEMEYGLERQWLGDDIHRDDLTGGLRFGIAPNLDLHWASSDFLRV